MEGFSLIFVFKTLVITILLFVIFFLLGKVVYSFLPVDTPISPLVEGFVVFLGVFQAVVIPILIFRWSFNLALLAFFLMIVAIGGLAIWRGRKYPAMFSPGQKLFGMDTFSSITLTLCILLILLQGIGSSYLNFQNPDDSFYIGLAQKSIDNPSLYRTDPSTGDPRFPLMSQYRFESWELFQAIVSKLGGLHAAELAHTVLPLLLVVLAYLSYAFLGRHFIPKRYLPLFLILLSIFHIMGGYSQYSQGSFLLTRIWQGKAVLLHIILPFWLSLILDALEHPSKITILRLGIVSLAGSALNPIAVFMLPIPLVLLILAHLIDKRFIPKRVLFLLFSILPLLLFAIGLKLSIGGSPVFDNPEDLTRFSPSMIFSAFMGNGRWMFLGYIVVMLALFVIGNRTSRLFFVYLPILLLLIIWNPIFAPWIARYFTSLATYWRVYWILPIGMGYALLLVFLIHQKKWISLIVSSAATMLVGFSMGNAFIYSNPALYRTENPAKLPNNHIQAVQYLSDQNPFPDLVLTPEELAISVPQLSTNIRLFWSRSDYIQEFLFRENQRREFNRRLRLEMIYNFGNDMSSEEIRSEIESFGIDVVVIPEGNIPLITKIEQAGLSQTHMTPGYLYYHPGSSE